MSWLTASQNADTLLQLVAWIAGAGALAASAWRSSLATRRAGLRRAAFALLAACAIAAAWASFFQSRNGGSWLHRWDLFHTAIGAKYFPELGYDHLYDCAYVLASRVDPAPFAQVKKIRDLGTLRSVRADEVRATNDCDARFSPERRRAFVRDVLAFSELGLESRWHRVFKDKGYNGTPFYTLLARAVLSHLPIRSDTLLLAALLDLALLAGALFVVGRTRGPWVALLVLCLLATCYPSRFIHMGGSFLRYDYLAALMVGLCALSTGRPALAGGLLAYATLVRVFPVLFAGAVLVAYAARGYEDRALPRAALRFTAGFALAVVVLGGATFVLADGARDWPLWWSELQGHTKQSAAFRIGFKHMFMMDGNLLGEDGFVDYEDKAEHLRERLPWYWACTLALLAPIALRARRWDAASFAALFGTAAFFLVLIATRYYYAVLVLPLLADPRALGERAYLRMAGLLLVATASTYAIASWNDFAAFLNNTVVTTQLTVLTLLLSGWSAWAAWTDRAARAERSAPHEPS